MRFLRAGPIAVAMGVVAGLFIAHHQTAFESFVEEAIDLRKFDRVDFPIVENEAVRYAVDRYTTSQALTIRVSLKRSGRWEGMIRRILREHGIPEELVYLPLVESTYDPNARSPAHAVGLWQFIPETGRRYGLRIDRYVDERRDPELSTYAAARYLSDLHDRFGSWYLAAAGYNSGENRVGRIMREETGSERGRETDYWRIRHRLPRETQNYVPRLIAATIVADAPAQFGFDRVERWSPLSYDVVTAPPGTPIASIARATGTAEREIAELNPALLRSHTPPDVYYRVRIPAGQRGRYLVRFREPRLAPGAIPAASETVPSR